MNYSYTEEDIKELERIKTSGLSGRQPSDITQLGLSLYSHVREMFPINQVPRNVQTHLLSLQETLKIAEDQWHITLDAIINEIKKLTQKKDEQECPYAKHILHLRCDKCNTVHLVFFKDAKDWKCDSCLVKNKMSLRNEE